MCMPILRLHFACNEDHAGGALSEKEGRASLMPPAAFHEGLEVVVKEKHSFACALLEIILKVQVHGNTTMLLCGICTSGALPRC